MSGLRASDTQAGVALTQISANITHKNVAVRKIMEVMRITYAKKKKKEERDSVSTRLKQNMTQTIKALTTRVC